MANSNINSILITDPIIIEYFTSNPHLDPNTLIVSFIEILKQLSTNISQTMTNASITQLFSRITDLKSTISAIPSELTTTIRDQTGKIENIILKDRDRLGEIVTDKTSMAVSATAITMQSAITNATNTYNTSLGMFQNNIRNQITSTDEKTLEELRDIKGQLLERCYQSNPLLKVGAVKIETTN